MFFLFVFCYIQKFSVTNPVVREKRKVKLALVLPTSAPTMLVNEIIDAPLLVSPLLVAIKTLKTLSI